MNILTISNYFPIHAGGIEIVAKNLVERWRKEHHVRWAASETTLRQERHADDSSLVASNFTETYLGFPYPIPSLSSILKIIRHVHRCDIVHLHDCLYLSNIIAFLSAKALSKPVVVTQHISVVTYQEKYKNLLQIIAYKTIGRLVLEGSDEVVFINQKIRKRFQTTMKLSRTTVLENGVDHKIFLPSQSETEKLSIRKKLSYLENDIIFLFVGRFTQKKGVYIIREIAKSRPNYKWLMVGTGEVSVSNWGVENIKTFPYQPQDKLREFYVAADLFVLPSWGEGFPLSVQEAMTCGLPAAVSDETASSLPDAPLISLDIFSIPNIDKTLDDSLAQPNFLKELSTRSVNYAKRWDWNLISNQYLDEFRKFLQ